MESTITVPVDIPLVGDERRKNWAKVVHAVDATKASGWAFEGEFIAAGGIQDVPIGAVVVVYGERGSRANPQIEARVYTANADGTLSPHGVAKGKAWARTLRDEVERLVEVPHSAEGNRGWDPALVAYGDDALIHEMDRRGYAVTPLED